jgi:hypothetical protein
VFGRPAPQRPATFWTAGEGLAWVAGLVLMLSPFMAWYSGSGDGITVSLIGWHTGVIGKLVFFVGLAVLVLLALRATGVEPPPSLPLGMLLAGVGALATILVIVRVIDIPDELAGAGRAIGLWISLLAALALLAAGFLKAADEP